MREISYHKSGLEGDPSDKIQVWPVDEPGSGGANHEYRICINGWPKAKVQFQKGAIQDNEMNGCSNEAVLAVVIDRLAAFQKGPFACEENEQALVALHKAMHYLHMRTRRRMVEGAEGKEEGR